MSEKCPKCSVLKAEILRLREENYQIVHDNRNKNIGYLEDTMAQQRERIRELEEELDSERGAVKAIGRSCDKMRDVVVAAKRVDSWTIPVDGDYEDAHDIVADLHRLTQALAALEGKG